jgi:hypothetical protein
MNNVVWELFKKTGDIEAYLYLCDAKNLDLQSEEAIDITLSDDNNQHTGDST